MKALRDLTYAEAQAEMSAANRVRAAICRPTCSACGEPVGECEDADACERKLALEDDEPTFGGGAAGRRARDED